MPESREMAAQIDLWAKQPSEKSWTVEEFEALDHYLRAQSQGRHTIDRLEEKVRLTKWKRSATGSERNAKKEKEKKKE